MGISSISTYALGATITATWVSGSGFFIDLTEFYSRGLIHFIESLGMCFALAITGMVIAPKMKRFLGKISVASIMGEEYGQTVRLITAFSGCFAVSGGIYIQFKLMGKVLFYLLPFLNESICIFISSLIVIGMSPHVVQRISMGINIKQVKYAYLWSAFWLGVVLAFSCYFSYLVFQTDPYLERDKILPAVLDIFSVDGTKAILVIVANDTWKCNTLDPFEKLTFARYSTIGIGLLALLFCFKEVEGEKMRVLLIEDDNSTAKSIELALARKGIICDIAQTGQEGVDLGMIYDYDIILLDLVLPDIDGYKVMEKLKAGKIKTPVFILSGLSSADKKIKALELGADDYLTKPFDKAELLARMKVIVRRFKGHCESTSQFGNFTINFDTRTLDANSIPIHLTNKEYAILELLAMRKGTVVTKEMFLNHLYSGVNDPSIKIVDVFICKIRQKLSKASSGINCIETVQWYGYMLKDRQRL
ncbi:unnamed protein product [Rotaria magnacalcarata]|uniref:OmpR-like protein n=1 Tax=Rotaria magnacalcarata TaxID=392030 RepID=A0A819DJ03_9BILA|nr:unnamed protein product [Rotaria magnacalcarata]